MITQPYRVDAPLVSWDTETELFSFGSMAPRVVCHSFGRREYDRVHTVLKHRNAGSTEAIDLLRRAAQGALVIAGQNISYDIAVLLRHRPDAWPVVIDAYEAGGIHDTMIAEWLLDTARGVLRMKWDEEKEEWKANKSYSLEAMAHARLGWPFYKDEWRLRYAELMDVPLAAWPEAARVYPQKDAEATLLIAEQQREDAARVAPHDPLVADLAAQCRAYLALHLASCWGQEIDPDAARDLKRRLEEECARLAGAGLIDAGLLVRQVRGKDAGKLNRKMDPLRALVLDDYAQRGLETPLTDGGRTGDRKVKTSAEVLADCESEILREVMHPYLKAQKIIGYADRLLALGRGPLHPRYGWAETGRTTCSGGKVRAGSVYALNVQNFPRDLPGKLKGQPGVRECVIARAGHVFSSTDYSGLELVTFAQAQKELVGAGPLLRTLNEGKDAHSIFGANLIGVGYEDFLALLAKGDKRAKEARQIAKVADFGFLGGMGAPKFTSYARQQELRISEDFSYKLKSIFTKAWQPKSYFDFVGELVGDDGEASVIQLRSYRIRGGVGFTDAANGYFQGLAADLAKDAAWRIMVECYDARKKSVLLGSRLVAFVHDEYICEHPEESAHEGATRVGELAREAEAEWCPDVKPKAEPALMRRWSKAAGDPVHDKRGRLIPWEDRPKKKEVAA